MRPKASTRSLKFQIVEQARALIAEESHWCRGDLARDTNGVGVCPTSDSATRRCGLGALIMAAYRITNDRRQAHDLAIKAMALVSPSRSKHICKLQSRSLPSWSSYTPALGHRTTTNWAKEICAFRRALGHGPPSPALLSHSSHAKDQRA